MDVNIRELSDSFLKLLPRNKEKLTLSDIESSGIPFLVRKRITQAVFEHFKQSVSQPESVWANLESAKAKALWDNYLQQMADVLEIPSEEAGNIIEEATEDVLKLAVQPRKTILNALFEDSDTVTREKISGVMDRFVTNRHLLLALDRYMERKRKESLEEDEARRIINKVDEKLCESYNSLDWMEAVKPIFNVAGPAVASGLMRIFFEEKELRRVARKFDMLEADLTETDFVEVMSSADLLDLSGFEEEQPALFADEEIPSDENETAELPEPEDPSVDGEKAESTLSDNFANRDADEEFEKAEDEAETEELEEEFVSEDDEKEQEEEQFEPNLLQLFREDEEDETESEDEEKYLAEEAEDETDKEPEKEFDPVSDEESLKTENEQPDESIEEAADASEKETETADWQSLEEEKTDTLGEVSAEREEHEDFEHQEIPREEELINDHDEEEKEEDWEEDKVVEEGSLLESFREVDHEPWFADPADEDPDEEKNSEPTTIYDELNLSPFEEKEDEEEPDEEMVSFDKKVMDDNEEPEDETPRNDLPFEPNDRIGEQFDEEDDSDDFGTYSPTAPESGDDFDVASPEDEDEDETGVPMWKSFLESDNPDDEPSFYFDEGSDESTGGLNEFNDDEDEINETPVISISGEASKIDDEIEHLSKWLAADYDRFLHEIFNDSKLAWEQALIDLTVFDDWKSASRYLQNEIFNKNQIDIYSEIAVDFTDYLHSYFMEYKS